VPSTGKITIALPRGYFSAADATKDNTFVNPAIGTFSTAKAKCTLAPGSVGTTVLGISDAQTLTCDMNTAILAVGPALGAVGQTFGLMAAIAVPGVLLVVAGSATRIARPLEPSRLADAAPLALRPALDGRRSSRRQTR
jgi:hypothetical protein